VLIPLLRARGFGRNDCEPACAGVPLGIRPKSLKAGVWKKGSAPCRRKLPAGRGDCALPTAHFPASSCGATTFWNIRLLSNVTILIWGFSELHRDHMPSAFESARRCQQFAEEPSSIARQMDANTLIPHLFTSGGPGASCAAAHPGAGGCANTACTASRWHSSRWDSARLMSCAFGAHVRIRSWRIALGRRAQSSDGTPSAKRLHRRL
jgi:hypothetical protein